MDGIDWVLAFSHGAGGCYEAERRFAAGAVGMIGLGRCLVMKRLSCLPPYLKMSFPKKMEMELSRSKYWQFHSFRGILCNIKNKTKLFFIPNSYLI